MIEPMSFLPSTQMRKQSNIDSYFMGALVYFLCLLLVISLFSILQLLADHLLNLAFLLLLYLFFACWLTEIVAIVQ